MNQKRLIAGLDDSFAARLYRARKLAGVSRADLAHAARVHPNTIARWEDVTTTNEPGPTAIAALAIALDVSPSWLAGFAEAAS